MGSRSVRRGVCLFGVFVTVAGCLPSNAWADCSRGTRPSTLLERRFQVETLKAVKAAMPAAPDGWRVVEETEVRPPRLACIGQEREPLPIEYRIRFAELDAKVSEITVRVNARREAVPASTQAVDVSRAALAFRAQEGATGAVRVLFGDWSLGDSDASGPEAGEALAHFMADLPHTQAQSLAVRIDGDRTRVDQLLARLNVSALASLVR
jgi:hypothetical protein